MAGLIRGNDDGVAPRPKSPPGFPDLYGKRRELARLQLLDREIRFLQEEVKFVEGLQPASRSCKEVAEFILCNDDPLIPMAKKIRKSRGFWKWFCDLPCFSASWICHCCSSPRNSCKPWTSSEMPSCGCSSCHNCQCFDKSNCCSTSNCCLPQHPSCFTCSRIKCRCCSKVNTLFSCCNKSCCCFCC